MPFVNRIWVGCFMYVLTLLFALAASPEGVSLDQAFDATVMSACVAATDLELMAGVWPTVDRKSVV